MAIIDTAKEAVRLAQKIDNIPLYRQVLDLQAEALDMMSQLAERDRRIQSLQLEVSQLKDAITFKGQIVFFGGLYFEKGIDGGPVGHPFCPRCWEIDSRSVHVHQGVGGMVERQKAICPECKGDYGIVHSSQYPRSKATSA